MHPSSGFPKTLNAIAAMNDAFTAAGIALPLPPQATVADADRYEAGLALQAPLYGTEIADRYGDLPPNMPRRFPGSSPSSASGTSPAATVWTRPGGNC